MANHSSKSYIASYFGYRYPHKNIFWIVSTSEELLDIWKSLPLWTDRQVIPITWEITDIQKINLICDLYEAENSIFLISKDKLSEKFCSYKDLSSRSYNIKEGDEIDIINFFSRLSDMWYEISLDAIFDRWFYRRSWWIIDVFPINSKVPYKIEINWNVIEAIYSYDTDKKTITWKVNNITLFPRQMSVRQNILTENIKASDLIIKDELEFLSNSEFWSLSKIISCSTIEFNSFPEDHKEYHHLRYLSVIKFYSVIDLISDLRQKIKDEWKIVLAIKRDDELREILTEKWLAFSRYENEYINIVKLDSWAFIPHSFQNPDEKFLFLSEKEIFNLSAWKRNKSADRLSIDFITSLKPWDYVVHFNHWIWLFLWLTKKEIDWAEREYLEIKYEGTDKLFVPIDQVDKVSKYLIDDDATEPKLSRLWSNHWNIIQSTAKKETEEIAAQLLELYAKRSEIHRPGFIWDTENQLTMESNFPYDLTPWQSKAIFDIKQDMESVKPMDRLLVWDVGFWKTEVSIRAAFKASESWKQVAVIAPVTILAIQHYETFIRRMRWFWKRIEVLTRFKSIAQQKSILSDLKKWKIDILIWTHRLLSPDVEFFNLWLLIIDEEHRFWVKQKETLKQMRLNVDVLTMTATPIPRTLNMWLNKIRDITTITTPPPWRLPIISEVRRYSDYLVRDAILKEVKRWWQVYFLHNRVETIEWIAEKLRIQIPEVTFIVAHGQLSPNILEERVMQFKQGKYNVLISSTIIENWIDLSSANTMIVNNAERFGLSQLYQLRWRIWRSNVQAFAFFLYHTQWLSMDAKKRLKAIIEASELWSWFQIAMKDLEIRWAWDILGCKQSWTMKVVWASHFLRLLNRTIEELRAWKKMHGQEVEESTTIDLPINAIIPESYIPDSKEKMSVYQRLSAVTNEKLLNEVLDDIIEEYWPCPQPVKNLCNLIRLKMYATKACISKIFSRAISGNSKEIVFALTSKCDPKKIVRVLDINSNWQIRWDSIAIDVKYLPTLHLVEIEKSVKVMM